MKKLFFAFVLLFIFFLGCIEVEKETAEEGKNKEVFVAASVEVGPNYIYLKDKFCRLYVGITEEQAYSIDRGMKGIRAERPSTHDLIVDILKNLNFSTEVRVMDSKEGTFYASLILKKNDEIIEIDSRPSDAIAIAVRMNSSIYVKKEVMEKYGECKIVEGKIGLSV